MRPSCRRSSATAALIAALAGLSACQPPPPPSPPPRLEPQAAGASVYTCADGSGATLRRGAERSGRLFLPGRSVAVEQVPAASGVLWEGGGTSLHSKGLEALLTLPDGRSLQCWEAPDSGPWVDARLRGIDYRGVGQEPGWLIEIDHARIIHLALDYGQREVWLPPVRPAVAGDRATYVIDSDGAEAVIVIDDAPCTDPMSGEAFPTRVSVTLNGQRYDGCGRFLE